MRSLKTDSDLYECSFNLLYKTLTHICNSSRKKLLSDQKQAVLLITPRIVQSLLSIRVLNPRGYYYDVAIIERSFLESIGLCCHLALDQEDAENWFRGRTLKTAKINMLDQIGRLLTKKEPTEEKGMKRMYGLLSEHVHTDLRAIVSNLVSLKEKRAVELLYFPSYDKERVDGIACYPTLALDILAEIFADELTKGRKTKIKEFIDQYLREVKKDSKLGSH